MDLDFSDRLQELEEFKNLSDPQKQVLLAHLADPSADKGKIARKLGFSEGIVTRFFHSKHFEAFAEELALQVKRELLLVAIQNLRELLHSKDEKIRFAASLKVLQDANVIKAEPRQVKQDNRTLVLWAGDKTQTPLGEIPLAADNSHTVLPA